MAILLAAFKVLLHRYARQDEIVVGISDSGRDRQDLREVVGPLANLLVVRSHLEPTSTFEELTRAVNARVERVRRHRAMPFDLLVREINPEKDMSRTALFDVLFTFEDETRVGSLAFGEVEATSSRRT
jgi:non-ribosomal peptide synthetase component F